MEAQRCIWRCLAAANGDFASYEACVYRVCDHDEEPAAPQFDGRISWSFLRISVVGDAAIGQMPDGLIGFSCGSSSGSIVIHVTSSLIAEGSAVLLVQGYGTTLHRQPRNFSLFSAEPCKSPLLALLNASVAHLIPGTITALGPGDLIEIERGGRRHRFRTADEALLALGGRSISLAGFRNAINFMLTGCPGAMPTNCTR